MSNLLKEHERCINIVDRTYRCRNKATANGFCYAHGGITKCGLVVTCCRDCPCYDDVHEHCNLNRSNVDIDVGNGYELPKTCPLRSKTVLLKADAARLTEAVSPTAPTYEVPKGAVIESYGVRCELPPGSYTTRELAKIIPNAVCVDDHTITFKKPKGPKSDT